MPLFYKHAIIITIIIVIIITIIMAITIPILTEEKIAEVVEEAKSEESAAMKAQLRPKNPKTLTLPPTNPATTTDMRSFLLEIMNFTRWGMS